MVTSGVAAVGGLAGCADLQEEEPIDDDDETPVEDEDDELAEEGDDANGSPVNYRQ